MYLVCRKIIIISREYIDLYILYIIFFPKKRVLVQNTDSINIYAYILLFFFWFCLHIIIKIYMGNFYIFSFLGDFSALAASSSIFIILSYIISETFFKSY